VVGPASQFLDGRFLFLYMPPLTHTHVEKRRPKGRYGMKTFYQWLAERVQAEGLWLNDKLAVPGLSNVSPLNKLKGAKPNPPKPTVAKGFTPLKPLKLTPPATFKPKLQ
jgi:hypothetical protein